jgi:NAD(P)H-flavin reductase
MAEGEFRPRGLRVENVARRTDSVWLFTFAADEASRLDDLAFEPGQVAVLSLPDYGEAYLAIASAPDDPTSLEFLVKRTGDLGERLCDLGRSAEATLVGLVGRGFPVGAYEGKNLLFVAAGTGVAPVRAAIAHAVKRRARFGRITLVHGVRTPSDFAVDDDLDRWRAAGVDVRLVVSQPGAARWDGPVGRVQALLDGAVPDAAETAAFVCGSDEMMDETSALLERLGVRADRIFRNY